MFCLATASEHLPLEAVQAPSCVVVAEAAAGGRIDPALKPYRSAAPLLQLLSAMHLGMHRWQTVGECSSRAACLECTRMRQHLDAEACAAPRILAANVDGAPRTAVLAAKACAAASTIAAALDGAPQTAAGHDAQAAPLPQPG